MKYIIASIWITSPEHHRVCRRSYRMEHDTTRTGTENWVAAVVYGHPSIVIACSKWWAEMNPLLLDVYRITYMEIIYLTFQSIFSYVFTKILSVQTLGLSCVELNQDCLEEISQTQFYIMTSNDLFWYISARTRLQKMRLSYISFSHFIIYHLFHMIIKNATQNFSVQHKFS